MYMRHGLISSLSAIGLMVLMLSCGNKGQVSSSGSVDSLSVDSVATEVDEEVCIDSIKTDTVSFSKEDGIYKFGLVADYPVAGPDSVVKKIREFINDFFGGAYEGSLADGNGMIARNGEMSFGNFLELCGDADLEEVNELFQYKSVNKGYETGKFVTFNVWVSQYTGGLHGIGFEEGHTFSKVNGQCFGYEMMRDLDTPAFKQLIKEGLKRFFTSEDAKELISDNDLLQELVSYSGSADEIPLPDNEPYMTEKGVTFIYQPYEISYYAAGKPEFTISYDIVRPYLTQQAIELFMPGK